MDVDSPLGKISLFKDVMQIQTAVLRFELSSLVKMDLL